MFEFAESDPSLPEAAYKKQEDTLRTQLVLQQYQLLQRADRTVLLVIAGIDGAGKGSTINLLNEWLDPRHIRTMAFGPLTSEERRRPAMWRYWNTLPAKGQIGIVFGSWYAGLLAKAYAGNLPAAELAATARHIRRFENMLFAEGVQIVKLWFHLSREAQQQRCDRLSANPDTAWRVSDADRLVVARYDNIRAGAEPVLRATQHANASWHVVPSADDRHRIVATARHVLEALTTPMPEPDPGQAGPPHPDVFVTLNYDRKLPKATYQTQLPHWQGRLSRAVRQPQFGQHSLVLVFEGDDAAGKGGTIRRITHALDVRQYQIMPVSAPTDEERARPYLWRFWRNIPTLGRVAIFDRSWYGRVLVERVEGFVAPVAWERAYTEIMDFEQELVEHGAIVLKFWLAITQDEQLKRFKAREKSPFKSFKLTPDDWRNRALNADYRAAASEMLAHTSTQAAPWHVIATNDKRLARVTVLQHVVQAVEARLSAADDSP